MKDVQAENVFLKDGLKRCEELVETLKSEKDDLLNDVLQKAAIIESHNGVISGLRIELRDSKNQVADYKKELDSLANTKAVIDKLYDALRSPHNDYQNILEKQKEMLQEKTIQICDMEQHLRDIQFDIQQNKYLEGKVQAYESMLQINAVRRPWEDSEQIYHATDQNGSPCISRTD